MSHTRCYYTFLIEGFQILMKKKMEVAAAPRHWGLMADGLRLMVWLSNFSRFLDVIHLISSNMISGLQNMRSS